MVHLRSAVVTALFGLAMTMTQAVPAQADIGSPAPEATPSAPMAGERFHLQGQLDEAPVDGTVYLQRLEGSTWSTLTSQGSADGSYDFVVQISAATRFRVAANRAGGDKIVSSSLRVDVAVQYVKLVRVERICGAGNACQDTARAFGYVRPAREGRTVTLQYLSGSTWKNIASDSTDSSGSFNISFSIGHWSQWRSLYLRIAAGSYAGATYAVSSSVRFMPGPKTIGTNVLRVEVDGGTFPQTKGVDYTGYATLVQDGVTTIDRARLDKFGVRGSTTSGYPKKPYNLRFDEDEPPPTEVFGMDGDRKWTLLAMYADQSYVRDKTALDLGRTLAATGTGMTWNPDSEYVEMFVNSEYQGAYLMTEKVDIDGDRVDVDKDTGMIMEVDMDKVSDPRKGFMTSLGHLVFAFKEPDSLGGSEGITSGKLSAVKNKVAAVESYLYSSSKRNYFYQHIDRDSAADFHLAVEFAKDIDADFWRSKYFSWDQVYETSASELRDNKLHFGPLWDFDKSMGNVDATNPGTAFTRSYRGWAANGTGVGKDNRVTYYTHWFVQLWKVAGFRADLVSRWSQVRGDFWRAANYEVDKNRALIGPGASNDRYRWAGSAKLYKAKGSTYQDEVNYVKYWLLNRFNWIDSQL